MNKLDAEGLLFLRQKANWVRRKVLEIAVRANSGHVTTAFSLTELLLALYHGRILNFDPANSKWEDRDRFILSEGQAGLGLYPVLADIGFFPLEYLDNFAGRGSTLGVHSEPNTNGIEVVTGSLGHGLPMATGIAYAGKLAHKNWVVVCLTGDGELFEGSNWEAMLTASRLELSNLVLVVNRNHQFTIGFTDRAETQRDVILDPVDKKFQAFGFETRTIADGHSFLHLFAGLSDFHYRASRCNRPLAVIVETKKGKGVSVMEGERFWHYRVPVGEELEIAHKELFEEAQSLGLEV